ncbi:hypothetical protein B0H14DRAFT_3085412 [Mycena olivaceomarginata]|nr:hypothetical protein B0H14DRAFT_3085412 [Mycena olivaceomarginata]
MASLSAMWWWARHPPADPTHLSYKNKAVLVTGASSGLGHQAAIKYAALGAPLVLAVRTQEKGEQAQAAIMRPTGCAPSGSFASIQDFCARVHKRLPELHVVQIAAGIAEHVFVRTADGHECQQQVNVLGQALLALLLLPKLRATVTALPDDAACCHLSFVNSVAHLEVAAEDLLPGQTLVQRCDDESKWDMYFVVGRSAEEGARTMSHGKFWTNDQY